MPFVLCSLCPIYAICALSAANASLISDKFIAKLITYKKTNFLGIEFLIALLSVLRRVSGTECTSWHRQWRWQWHSVAGSGSGRGRAQATTSERILPSSEEQ